MTESDDARLFRTTTRRFLENEVPLDAIRAAGDNGGGFDRAWWQRGADLGWTSLLVDERLGGGSVSGAGLLDAAAVAEEMGRLVSPGPFIAQSAVLVGVGAASTADANVETLESLVAGDLVASWAVCEPTRPWSLTSVETRAEPDGHGGFTMTGVKDRVESGDQADLLLVLAATNEGLRQFLVAADAPGVEMIPQAGLDLVRRFATVHFNDVALPASAAVGTSQETAGLLERQLDVAVVLQCAEIVGALDRVFDFTVQWAFDRYSFGRPLASYQALKHRFADMRTWLEACRATTAAAANAVQQRQEDASELASVAKSYVGQRATDIIQDCVQLHGGIGVTWEHDLHLYLRRVTLDRVTFGSPAEHRQRLADILRV